MQLSVPSSSQRHVVRCTTVRHRQPRDAAPLLRCAGVSSMPLSAARCYRSSSPTCCVRPHHRRRAFLSSHRRAKRGLTAVRHCSGRELSFLFSTSLIAVTPNPHQRITCVLAHVLSYMEKHFHFYFLFMEQKFVLKYELIQFGCKFLYRRGCKLCMWLIEPSLFLFDS